MKILKNSLIILLFVYMLRPEYLFAVASQYQEIQKIEEMEQQSEFIIIRPRVEYTGSEDKDPFRIYRKTEDNVEIVVQKEVTPLPPLTIQGIIWGSSVSQAIVNNKVVKIGDNIDGVRITDIDKDGLGIFFEGQQYNLPAPANMGLGEAKQNLKGGM